MTVLNDHPAGSGTFAAGLAVFNATDRVAQAPCPDAAGDPQDEAEKDQRQDTVESV